MSTRNYHRERSEALLQAASISGTPDETRHELSSRALAHATLAALYPAPYNKDADE